MKEYIIKILKNPFVFNLLLAGVITLVLLGGVMFWLKPPWARRAAGRDLGGDALDVAGHLAGGAAREGEQRIAGRLPWARRWATRWARVLVLPGAGAGGHRRSARVGVGPLPCARRRAGRC